MRGFALLVLAVGVAASPPASATTWLAPNTTRDAVNTVIQDNALDGDTVSIPAGTSTWTNGITTTKDITIQGVIGGTIILNNFTTDSSNFRMQSLTASARPRITGITFRDGGQTFKARKGVIEMVGVSTFFRVDNCVFDRVRNNSFQFNGRVCGVVDHNTATLTGNTHFLELQSETWAGGVWGDSSWSTPIDWGSQMAVYAENNTITGDLVSDTYKGARAVIRFNTLIGTTIATHGTGDGAGRNRGPPKIEIYRNTWNSSPPAIENAVHIRGGSIRFIQNTLLNYTKGMTVHYYRFYLTSKGTFGRCDGLNAFDVPDLTDTYGTPGDGVFLAGNAAAGSGDNLLAVGGTHTLNQWVGYIARAVVDDVPATIWPDCRAASVGDINLASPGPTIDDVSLNPGDLVLLKAQLLPAANGLYTWSSATLPLTRITAADQSAEFVAGTTTGVTEGELNGGHRFQLITTTAITLGTTPLIFYGNFSSICKSSTTTGLLTVENGLQGYANFIDKPYRVGTPFELRRVLLALDMPGAGQGDLLLDKSQIPVPVNLHQIYEPLYSFGNTLNGATLRTTPDAGIVEDVHNFNQTNLFNGTSGIGTGTYASMTLINPTTHTNVGWWATDRGGDWDTFGGGANDGALYRWNGAAWVVDFVPLVYPHPLVSGTAPPPAPAAPSTLTATPVSSSQLTLQWADNSADETGFSLERSLTTATGFQPIASPASDTTTHLDGSLTQATTYYYRIRAFNSGGFSAYSAEASAATTAVVVAGPRGQKIGLVGLRRGR